ncbi:MAG: molybdate ABC transporter permease subunit [Acidimicrobiia bacterium]|nr:molybdate ABC transporter permease subunit [Acidimicrobiia bacterium]MDH5236383.1 molybdate ABC transporter permease subunit [Acidimicrobiia bacterium]
MRPPTRTPRLLAVPAVLGVTLLTLPIVALLWRMPWSSVIDLWAEPETVDALRISLVVSLTSAALSVLLGLPLAWFLGRMPHRWSRVVRAVVLLPMVLPPVVAGTALLFALSPRRGLLGPALDGIGITLPFTTAGAVLAATVVALPFFVITAESALHPDADGLEDAATTLGASPATVLRRITLPRARPAIAAGAALAWARALGEFGATLTFAGNVPGRTRTLPLAIFEDLEGGRFESALAVSLIMLAVSLSVLVSLREKWLLR